MGKVSVCALGALLSVGCVAGETAAVRGDDSELCHCPDAHVCAGERGCVAQFAAQYAVELYSGNVRYPAMVAWDSGDAASKPPDPFAVLFAGDAEVLRTAAMPDTYDPSWPQSPEFITAIAPDTLLRVAMYDDDGADGVDVMLPLAGLSAEQWIDVTRTTGIATFESDGCSLLVIVRAF